MFRFFLFIFIGSLTLNAQTALWVVRDALHSQKSLEKVINVANQIGCKTIFLQVRALGELYYKTDSSLPQKYDIDLNNFFDAALNSGIDVHFWINCFYVANKNKLASDHILNRSSMAEIYSIDNKEFSKIYTS